MTNYTPADNWATPQIPDLSDFVKGGTGLGNNSSVLQEQLADRTQYLYNRLGGYIDVADIVSATTINNTYANKLISVVAGANVTLTLAALSTFIKGNRIAFVANLSGAGGPFWLNIVTPDSFIKGAITRTNIWLYDGEMIEIVCGSSAWHWTINQTNYAKGIGEVDLKRFQPANTLLGDGTAGYLRSKFPRIWEVISGTVVTDANWLSDTFRYRQQFADGNGTTTFRSADYRAMFFRALDGGRGADIGRLDSVVGGYEADCLKSFTATFPGASAAVAGGNSGVPNVDVHDTTIEAPFNGGVKTITKAFTVTGAGSEVRTKSVAFNPYIYY